MVTTIRSSYPPVDTGRLPYQDQPALAAPPLMTAGADGRVALFHERFSAADIEAVADILLNRIARDVTDALEASDLDGMHLAHDRSAYAFLRAIVEEGWEWPKTHR